MVLSLLQTVEPALLYGSRNYGVPGERVVLPLALA